MVLLSDSSLLVRVNCLLLRVQHGGPLAMAMYAIAVTPLINYLRQSQPDISQVWFADDTTAAGKLAPLLQWWKLLISGSSLWL